MRDMVPRDDRSIRNIPVPAAHHRRTQEYMEEHPQRRENELRPKSKTIRRKGMRRLLIIGTIVVVICAAGGLLLSTLFAGATVTVYPRQMQVTVPPTLIAESNAPVGMLSYEIMTITRSASTTVQATGSKNVSRAATGVVTIYNSYGSESQRLIANTRFEASDGKIYRVRDSVVVPGMSNGSPGTAVATVYADSPGVSYNRGQTRFTIPGFKGDPRYDKFYAETSAISGGYVGPEPSVAPTDLTKAREVLQQGLARAAQGTLGSQIPAGYIPVPGTIQATYSEITQTPGEGTTAIVGQSITMSAVIVSQELLAHIIAKQSVQGYAGESVIFKDVTAVTLAAATSSITSTGRITLNISGTPTLIWRYDANKLADSLVGKNKNEFEAIIKQFSPAITRAEAKLRPFWDSSFPSERDNITVVEGK